MDFAVECRGRADADAAIEKINAALLELAVRETNFTSGSGLGGNPKQLVILSAMKHVITHKRQGVYLEGDKCYWNVNSIAPASRKEIRRYIDIAFEQKVPDSNVGHALLLRHLLAEGPKSRFLNRYEIESDDLPEVRLVLDGTQFNVKKLTQMSTLMVATVATGLMSRKLDATYNWKKCGREAKEITIPEVDNVGSFLTSIPMETSLLVARSMVGLERMIMTALDEKESWDLLLRKFNSTLHNFNDVK